VPPTFDSEASVSLMTAHILRCLLAGKIDIRRAQVAMTCVRETAKSLRLQSKAGDRCETSFTAFMADYYSTLDEIQAKSAAVYPDPQPLIFPARFDDVPADENEADDLSSRAPVVRGEGSASSAEEQPVSTCNGLPDAGSGAIARATQAPLAVPSTDDRAHNRGRAGLQPGVAEQKECGAIAPGGTASIHSPLRHPNQPLEERSRQKSTA